MMHRGRGFSPAETEKKVGYPSQTSLQQSKTTTLYLQETISKTSAVKVMRSDTVIILFAFLVFGVFGDTHAVKSVSVMEGDSFILRINVSKHHHEPMRWYFNDSLIALINAPNTSCLYDGEDGRFRDRLEVDYETGSLNITDITTEHAGRYEAEIIRSESSGKRQSLNRNRKCDSTKINKKNIISEDIIITFNLTVSASDFGKNKNEAQIVPQDKQKKITVVAGICVAVLLLAVVVVGVICHKYWRSRNDKKKNKQVLL